MMIMRFAFWLLVFLIPIGVWADYSVEFVHITCIPETRFFEIEFKAVSGDAVFVGADVLNEGKQRLDVWKKHGYYDPSVLHYECRLPDSTYLVTSRQLPATASGRCGASPPIILSLNRNAEKWLDEIVFGRSDCHSGPSLTRVSICDGKAEWGTRNMDLCIIPSNESGESCEFLSETYSDVSRVMPLTQNELEQYVEANFKKEQMKPGVWGSALVREASLVDFKREVCRFPSFELPFDAVIYAIGGYGDQCIPYRHQIDQSGYEARVADITVNETNRPVILMLGAYEPMVWNIEWTEQTRIVGIFAGSMHRDAIAGIPKEMPIFYGHDYSMYSKPYTCPPFYVENPTKNDYVRKKNREQIDNLAKDLFGRPADQVFHFNNGCKMRIGQPFPQVAKVLKSTDIPLESFYDPKAPLAGELGLADGIKKGLLRRATVQDLEAWRKGELTLSSSQVDQSHSSELEDSYVVLKHYTVPHGLSSPSFFIPKGVPFPDGDRNGLTIYDSDTNKCVGHACPH